MASNINFTDIDETFPVPGKPNDSQILRNNFSTIKDSLSVAKTEIEELQSNAAKTDGDNDFNGNNLIDANLVNVSYTVTNLTADELEDEAYTISIGASQLHLLDVSSTDSAAVTITLNWEPAGLRDDATEYRFRSVRIGLQSSNLRTVGFSIPLADDVQYDASYPQVLDVTPGIVTVVELWTYGTGAVYFKLIGRFSTDIQGIAEDTPIASDSNYGVVKIGSGITVVNGIISGFGGSYYDLIDAPPVPREATLKDSIVATALRVSLAEELSDEIRLSNIALSEYYSVGQQVRLFGASSSLAQLGAPSGISTSLSATGDLDDTSGILSTFTYRACEFNIVTGAISSPGAVSTALTVDKEKFNNVNYISVLVTRTSSQNGVAIYRKIDSSAFNLIAVLGPTDAAQPYYDYYTFDYIPWSGKSDTDNAYDAATGIIHVPPVLSTTPSLGWVDTTIRQIDIETGTLSFSDSFYFKNTVTVVHNDTAELQERILKNSQINKNFLELDSKTYYVARLELPNNFSLKGTSANTILKKLPWSSYYAGKFENKIINAAESALRIGLDRFRINGDMQNQYLVSTSADVAANYAIDISGDSIAIDKVSVTNTIGGGIASRGTRVLRISNCDITNGGLTDQFSASPILADQCTNLRITDSLMENFSDAVDVSLTNVGAVTGNIVKNCGSGILTVGSRQLLVSPNLIIGPAGEYIPGPDMYNSEFDAVNISLPDGVDFFSDVYVYQENGKVFDLTANRGTLSYKVNKLRKIDNVEELGSELYSSSPAGGALIADYTPGVNKTQGQFRFVINTANVNKIKVDYAYSKLKAITKPTSSTEPANLLPDYYHVGLVYRALLSEYIHIGDIAGVGQIDTSTYTVTLTSTDTLFVGARVRLNLHGGSLVGGLSMNEAVGTVQSLNTIEGACTIKYAANVSVAGENGTLELEHTFVLAKGKIQ